MKRFYFSTALAVTIMLALVGNAISRDRINGKMRANLSGYQEVPVVSTKGSGDFQVKLNELKTALDFELSYENLEGTATSAYIQFGQPGANGGMLAALCGAGGKQACAPSPITGTIAAADILAIPSQGIAAGEFEEALRAIRSGNAYVNVKSSAFADGEIRGQIRGLHFEFGNFGNDD